MPADIRTALTTVNLSVPVAGGRLCLGTWQGTTSGSTDARRTRAVVVHIFGGES